MQQTFLVLHALRLKGLADARAVAGSFEFSTKEAEALLQFAAAQGLATERRGIVSGWTLTEAGRGAHARLLVAEALADEGRRELVKAYGEFLALNQELLESCTAWQLRDGVLNDHLDSAYDAECVARLRRVDLAVRPICDRLTGILGRYGKYGDRLRAARQKVEDGERDWFTKPGIDSYHSVWFELHEDLLVTLGIERGSETSTA